jgi:hypothetical protein
MIIHFIYKKGEQLRAKGQMIECYNLVFNTLALYSGLNLGLHTSYPEDFMVFLSPPGKCWDGILKQVMPAFVHIFPVHHSQSFFHSMLHNLCSWKVLLINSRIDYVKVVQHNHTY